MWPTLTALLLLALACTASAKRAGLAAWATEGGAKAQARHVKTLLQDEAANQGALRAEFAKYKATFNQPNADFDQFKRGLKRIAAINTASKGTYWAAPNQWTAKSWTDISASLGTVVPQGAKQRRAPRHAARAGGGARKLLQTPVIETVDWISAGGVSPVKDQGYCGSCWAFAATAGMESQLLIHTKAQWDLSEQQMVECAPGSKCNGGWPPNALNYATNTLETSDPRYPYSSYGGATSTCNADLVASNTPADSVRLVPGSDGQGFVSVPSQSLSSLLAAVKRGPVVTTFACDNSFAYYGGGIYAGYDPANPSVVCPNGAWNVNHAMLIVGYKYNNTGDAEPGDGSYWVLKNSWDTWWGEGGYIRVKMTGDGPGVCALYQWNWEVNDPVVPPKPSPSPAPPPVCSANANCVPAGQDAGCWTCDTAANKCVQTADGKPSTQGGYCQGGVTKVCATNANCAPAGQDGGCWTCNTGANTCTQTPNGAKSSTGGICMNGASKVCSVNADCVPAGQDVGCWTCDAVNNKCVQTTNGKPSTKGGYCLNGVTKVCTSNAQCVASSAQDAGCWTCNTGANTCTLSANGATSSTGGYCMNGSSKQCLSSVSQCKIPAGQTSTCWQCSNYTCSQKSYGTDCGTGKICSNGACVNRNPCKQKKKCPCYPYAC